ncbi:MAG: hypothetical protein HFJ32_00295 [Clostridia bacterium]|nr:hypothetical protein [Clostridia bacterium]
MLKTINSQIIIADSTLRTTPKKLRLVFKGAFGSYFVTPGLSFSLEDGNDMQELDLLMEITGVMGEGWQSQLVNKEVRLIIDFNEIARNDFRIAIKAIGHKENKDDDKDKDKDEDDDLFLVLNTKHTLVTEETAMKIITEEKAKENN